MDGSVAYLTSMEPKIIEPTLETNSNTETGAADVEAAAVTSVTQSSNNMTNGTQLDAAVPVQVVKEDGGDAKKRKLEEMTMKDQSPDWTSLETELANLLNNHTVATQVMHFLQQSTSLS